MVLGRDAPVRVGRDDERAAADVFRRGMSRRTGARLSVSGPAWMGPRLDARWSGADEGVAAAESRTPEQATTASTLSRTLSRADRGRRVDADEAGR